MSRTAIVLILLIALGTVSLGTYLLLFPRVEEIQLAEARAGLTASGRALLQMERAEQARLLMRLQQLAGRTGLVQLLAERPGGGSARSAWLTKLRAEVAGLSAAAHKASTLKDLFVLAPDGMGLVRNVDLHWTDKEPSQHPAIKQAVAAAAEGRSTVVMIADKGQLVRGIVVPVERRGRVLGILYAVFPVDRALARARTGELPQGLRLAFLTADHIPVSTLADAEQTALVGELKQDDQLRKAVLAGKRVSPEAIGLAGRAYLVTGLPGQGSPDGPGDAWGLLVFRSVQDLQRPVQELGLYLFGGTGLLFLFLVVLIALLGGRLNRCLKDLERDMLDIVHTGERRKVVGQGPTIVRSLGVLASQLSTGAAFEGREAPSSGLADAEEDEHVETPTPVGEANKEEAWNSGPVSDGADEEEAGEEEAAEEEAGEEEAAEEEAGEEEAGEEEAGEEEAGEEEAGEEEAGEEEAGEEEAGEEEAGEDAGPADSPGGGCDESAEVDRDGVLEYYRGLFDRFLAAKEETGGRPGKLDFDRFRAKLEKQARKIRAKHGCKDVRFEVKIKAGKVNLVPKIVR